MAQLGNVWADNLWDIAVWDQAIWDQTQPISLGSAAITGAGDTLTLTFSEAAAIGAGGNAGWTIAPSGGAATLTYASGDTTRFLVYNISRTIAVGETGTIAYTQPGNGIEAVGDGADVATIASRAFQGLTPAPVSSVSAVRSRRAFTIFRGR